MILTAIEPNGSATLKIYRNPLVNWIWIGGFTFVLGAIVLLWPHPDARSRGASRASGMSAARAAARSRSRSRSRSRPRAPPRRATQPAAPDVPAGAGRDRGRVVRAADGAPAAPASRCCSTRSRPTRRRGCGARRAAPTAASRSRASTHDRDDAYLVGARYAGRLRTRARACSSRAGEREREVEVRVARARPTTRARPSSASSACALDWRGARLAASRT